MTRYRVEDTSPVELNYVPVPAHRVHEEDLKRGRFEHPIYFLLMLGSCQLQFEHHLKNHRIEPTKLSVY
jgi:hypothetical protein